MVIKVKVKYNKLNKKQKQEIKDLIDLYFKNKTKFKYYGSARRENYAYPASVKSLTSDTEGCMYKDKYLLNCGLFAQMIWMGRSIEDFTAEPTTKITKYFDWGYYFDFDACKKTYGLDTSSSGNKYINDSGDYSYITFDNAAAMAQELYKKGYEIPYSQVDVGDLVFYRSPNISDESKDGLEQSSFRYITHVGIVYDVNENKDVTIIECSDAFKYTIGKSGLGDGVTEFGMCRGAGQEQRVVMCARHPIAWKKGKNVPENFITYRNDK